MMIHNHSNASLGLATPGERVHTGRAERRAGRYARGICLTGSLALASGICIASTAVAHAGTAVSRSISETQRITGVATVGKPTATAFSQIFVGTLDGKLDRRAIHGALRAIGVTNLRTKTEIVRGTEYDARGSRSAVLHVKIRFHNGQVIDTGTGRWTGGTGNYRHAHGTFEIKGGGPVGGVSTINLKGHISY